jgi:hypothetical protein
MTGPGDTRKPQGHEMAFPDGLPRGETPGGQYCSRANLCRPAGCSRSPGSLRRAWQEGDRSSPSVTLVRPSANAQVPVLRGRAVSCNPAHQNPNPERCSVIPTGPSSQSPSLPVPALPVTPSHVLPAMSQKVLRSRKQNLT